MVSAFFFSVSNVIVQVVEDVDPFNIAIYRFGFIFLIVLPIVILKEQDPFPKGELGQYFLSGLGGVILSISAHLRQTSSFSTRQDIASY